MANKIDIEDMTVYKNELFGTLATLVKVPPK